MAVWLLGRARGLSLRRLSRILAAAALAAVLTAPLAMPYLPSTEVQRGRGLAESVWSTAARLVITVWRLSLG